MLFYDILQLLSKQLMKLTIFTPTYNRAHLLPQLFASLQKQKLKNFEWLIVDDGSEDNTKEVVTLFQQESSFRIRYFYQKNQGKHIATNTGVQNTSTELFLTVDSDDELMENAEEIITSFLPSFLKNDKIAAICFPHFSSLENTTKTTKKIPFNEKILDSVQLENDYAITGEFNYLFKTEIIKFYPYPQFEDEKFIKESVVYNRIGLIYKNLYVKQSIVKGEYLQGGLSSNFRRLLEQSPNGAALSYLELVNSDRLSFADRKEAFRNYWYFENLAKCNSFWDRILKIKKKDVIFSFILGKLRQ